MTRTERKHRQLAVTEEPFILGESVRGRPLATVRRRGVAFVLDLVVCFFVTTPVLLLIALAALYLQAPSAARSVSALATGEQVEDMDRGLAEVLLLVSKRRPSAVPQRFTEALAAGDLDQVSKRLRENDSLSFHVDLGRSDPSHYDPFEDKLFLHSDVLFGYLNSLLGYFALGIGYFTLVTWLGRGRTPAKWLLGIRTLRLDGQPIRFLDAFSRAGGYTASASTIGLGFLESLWDPNRQALHDKVAATVVVRHPRRSLLPRKTIGRAWRAISRSFRTPREQA